LLKRADVGNKMRLRCTKAHAWEDDNITICTYVIRFVSFVSTKGGGRSSRVVESKIREEKCGLCNCTIALQSFGQIAPAYMKRVLQNKVHGRCGCMTKRFHCSETIHPCLSILQKALPPEIVSQSPCPFGTKRTYRRAYDVH